MNQTWTDEQILHALDLRDGDGLGPREIAQRMGRQRCAVAGVLHRIDVAQEPDAEGLLPQYRDGSMPRRWWAGGRHVPR